MLIEDLGVKPAERLVRSWVRNLAAAPFASEVGLRDALERGDCDFGIVSELPDGSSIATVVLVPTYLQIDGVGISRHAENADAAQQLVDWMLSDYQPDELNGSVAHNAGVAGWRDEDARLLAERAGYR
jgi:iron(III) transport system substrate-binding protein